MTVGARQIAARDRHRARLPQIRACCAPSAGSISRTAKLLHDHARAAIAARDRGTAAISLVRARAGDRGGTAMTENRSRWWPRWCSTAPCAHDAPPAAASHPLPWSSRAVGRAGRDCRGGVAPRSAGERAWVWGRGDDRRREPRLSRWPRRPRHVPGAVLDSHESRPVTRFTNGAGSAARSTRPRFEADRDFVRGLARRDETGPLRRDRTGIARRSQFLASAGGEPRARDLDALLVGLPQGKERRAQAQRPRFRRGRDAAIRAAHPPRRPRNLEARSDQTDRNSTSFAICGMGACAASPSAELERPGRGGVARGSRSRRPTRRGARTIPHATVHVVPLRRRARSPAHERPGGSPVNTRGSDLLHGFLVAGAVDVHRRLDGPPGSGRTSLPGVPPRSSHAPECGPARPEIPRVFD